MAEKSAENAGWPDVPPQEAGVVMRVFSASRYFAAFAVFGSFLAAITLYIYGAVVVIQTVLYTLQSNGVSVIGVQHLQVEFIEMTDVFLLGTVLFIVSFGLYQLFLHPNLPVPPWLKIQSLDQLSERLIEVVCVLLSVTFLAFAVGRVIPADEVNQSEPAQATVADAAETVADSANQVSLIELGISVAVVIAALSLLLVVSHRRAGNHGE